MQEVLKVLAERISRKAILLMTAMILIYMIVGTPTVVHAVLAIASISVLAVIGVLLQFYLDRKIIKRGGEITDMEDLMSIKSPDISSKQDKKKKK